MPRNSSISTSRSILGVAALGLAALGGLNYAVDPYQQYRPAVKPRFWHPLQRYIVPGLAKRGGYMVALLGSSMFEGFRNSEASQLLGGPTSNLSLSAISAYEASLLLDVAYRHANLKRVVLDLNVNTYAGPTNKRWVDEPLPLYLWDENPVNDVRYLWSWDTLARSFDLLLDRKGGPWFYNDPELPWGWITHYTFSRRAVTEGLNPANLNERFKQPARTAQEMIANFEANILPHIRRHPETRFDLVHPPYSVLAWADFEQRRQVEPTLEWKRLLRERVKGEPNTSVYDFQGAPATDDLDNYKDIYHFSGAISSWMLREIASGASAYRVTDANEGPMLAAQRERARTADPRTLVTGR